MRIAVAYREAAMKFHHSIIPTAVLLIGLLPVFSPAAQAQTFTVLHSFTGGSDGQYPWFGLTVDHAGNLYGTTAHGGNPGCGDLTGNGCGTVFRMVRENSSWVFAPLYDFRGGDDAGEPFAAPTIGPDGNVYGTTEVGGGDGCYEGEGCGTVYKLTPPPAFCRNVLCPWTETVLYHFGNIPDGTSPSSKLVFDGHGTIYGTTYWGGANDLGTIFSLTPGNGGWTEAILHNFTGASDGAKPWSGLIFDSAGELYGTTGSGGLAGTCGGCGTIFRFSSSGSGWTITTLHEFDGEDGYQPIGGLLLDGAGSLYGTTSSGGEQYGAGGGTIFTMSSSGAGFTTFYNFPGYIQDGPWDALIMDGAGNLYGTSQTGGPFGGGQIFKLSPYEGGWIFSSLHDFTGYGDGGHPHSNIVLDSQGNLYGVATVGGNANCSGGCGVVWEITP